MLKKYGKTVDDKHKLIVAADGVQDGNDSGQDEPMMTKACEATGNRSGGCRLLARRAVEGMRGQGDGCVRSNPHVAGPQGQGRSVQQR